MNLSKLYLITTNMHIGGTNMQHTGEPDEN